MHYVISDIHGYYDKYQQLLDTIGLGPEDTLYILGNLIGRGPEGLRLLRDASLRPNVVPLMGNHEFSAMVCLPWLQEELREGATRDEVLAARLQQVLSWKAEGGASAMEEFALLTDAQQHQVFDDLSALPLYREISAAGKQFVLVHAGLDHFSPHRPLADYTLDELILASPDLRRSYFPDKYLVFGHTPTPVLCARDSDPRPAPYPAGILRSGNLIGIDCGCGYGGRLGCLCLETFEETYI